MRVLLRIGLAMALIASAMSAAPRAKAYESNAGTAAAQELPQHLSATGLYVAGSMSQVRPENLPFSPQYPLWSDGAAKRRWLYLPPGTTIDATQPDAWEFPPGTRLWKEFSHGRRIETRFIERRADGSWRFATYIWNADGSDAVLAPAGGVPALPATTAPGGRYAIPSEEDCRACHEGTAVPVLGASTLQLSPDRDPLAPHAEPARADYVDLRGLVARGLLRNLPQKFLDTPPRIDASSATERAALGYLHGNCGHCHNDVGPLAPMELVLAQKSSGAASNPAAMLRSVIGEASRFRLQNMRGAARRVVPGHASESMLTARMQSRDPLIQMPPLGTRSADAEAVSLIARWINQDLQPSKEIDR